MAEATKKESAPRTSGLYVEHDQNKVAFIGKAGAAGDRANWKETIRFTVDLASVPDQLVCNDGTFTSAKAYGVRALLCDRASDFRSHGVIEYVKEIERVFGLTLALGRFDAERAAGKGRQPAVSVYLAQAVADAKGMEIGQAMAALSKLEKAQLDVLREKLASQIAALEKAANSEVVDLSDLLG